MTLTRTQEKHLVPTVDHTTQSTYSLEHQGDEETSSDVGNKKAKIYVNGTPRRRNARGPLTVTSQLENHHQSIN